MTNWPRSPLALVGFLVVICLPAALAQKQAAPINVTFTTIDVPGAAQTGIFGINSAGQMVGTYGQVDGGPLSSFLYSGGTFSYFDYPGQSVTEAGGINDSGVIVGFATQTPGEGAPVFGFLYNGTTFTKFQDAADYATFAFAFNNAGEVVGRAGSLGAANAFELRNGRYKTIPFPGNCPYATAFGINNLGDVVGATFCGIYEYGYLVKNGRLTDVDYPGAEQSDPFGINDSDVIVGYYNPASADWYAFVSMRGKYISFSYPGAVETFAYAINNGGQIVGSYSLDYQTYHGFVTNPIVPEDFGFEGCCAAASALTK